MWEQQEDFALVVKQTLIQVVGWGGLTLIIAALAGYSFLIPGLLTGTFASIIYLLMMCGWVRKCVGLPPAKAVAYMRSGWILRLTFVVLILILSLLLPQINFLAAVTGLFSLQFVIFFNAIYFVGKKYLILKKVI